MKPGYSVGGGLDGPLVAPTRPSGTHGYSPTHPELYSFFLIAGNDIPARGDLGDMDMRAIAPTLADTMHIAMPSATGSVPPVATIHH
jgi:hypothetical protein